GLGRPRGRPRRVRRRRRALGRLQGRRRPPRRLRRRGDRDDVMSAALVPETPAVEAGTARRTAARGRICRRDWSFGKTLLAVALMAGAVLAARDAWADIIHIARRDEEQSHVFLVPVVVAWLLWVRRERLRSYEPSARWVGPALIAVGWAMNWI